jgi:hypothetical protein
MSPEATKWKSRMNCGPRLYNQKTVCQTLLIRRRETPHT